MLQFYTDVVLSQLILEIMIFNLIFKMMMVVVTLLLFLLYVRHNGFSRAQFSVMHYSVMHCSVMHYSVIH